MHVFTLSQETDVRLRLSPENTRTFYAVLLTPVALLSKKLGLSNNPSRNSALAFGTEVGCSKFESSFK